MTLNHHNKPLTANRIAASALAAIGAASAIPIPLAQLDFAGLFNAFNIDSGDSPPALHVIAGAAGILTIAVIALAFAGAVLTFTGAPSARNILVGAALAGLATAMPLWIPAGVLIGAAALILGHSHGSHAAVAASPRDLPYTTGGATRTPA